MLRPTAHPSTISNWERGKRVPRPGTMAQLADLFNWETRDAEAVATEGWAARATVAPAAHGRRRDSLLEELSSRLKTVYDQAFEDGQLEAYDEAHREIQLLRKQLASERERVGRQREQLVELERRAEMRRLSEQGRGRTP